MGCFGQVGDQVFNIRTYPDFAAGLPATLPPRRQSANAGRWSVWPCGEDGAKSTRDI
jgi:hypothetical protein